jgi:hypothetical protein
MRRAIPALLALALSGCDGPLLFAELQVPALRATLPSQSFPASDTGDPAYWCSASQTDPPCIQTTLDYDLGGMVPILTDPNVTYDLRLTDVSILLSATEVGKDLSGISLASVSVSDPVAAGSWVVVASYVRPPGSGPSSAIGVSGNPNLDLAPYLDGTGSLRVRVELVIDQPTPAFLADVAAGFSLEVKLDYEGLL